MTRERPAIVANTAPNINRGINRRIISMNERTTPHSLCETCQHLREVVSGKGSRFLLCRLAQADSRWKKYPAQPVRQCGGYAPREAEGAQHDG